MNWNRGLFRVWLLVSVLWILAIGTVATNDWLAYRRQPVMASPSFSEFAKKPDQVATPLKSFDPSKPYTIVGHAQASPSYVFYISLVFGVPALLWAVGIGLLWAAKGFAIK